MSDHMAVCSATTLIWADFGRCPTVIIHSAYVMYVSIYLSMSRYVVHMFVMRARAHTHRAHSNDHYRIKYVHIQQVMIVNVIICVHIRRGWRRAKRSICNQQRNYIMWLNSFKYVIGSEKWDHFALNAKFYRFSNTRYSDSPSATGFILGLLAVQAFY